MVHLHNRLRELCREWNQKGYKGIYCVARLNDMERDRDAITGTGDFVGNAEMTVEQFEDWMRDYACFTFEPDLYSEISEATRSPWVDDELVAAEIRYKFWEDFNANLRKELGDDVKIDYREGATEYEVMREKKTEPAKV